jgi:hypothetical protein
MFFNVFICYRREDSAASAGWLHQILVSELAGISRICMDVDAVPLGDNFVSALSAELDVSDVVLALIGPRWLAATDKAGIRRLEQEDDYVRVELATALKRSIPIIPIMLDGTQIPEEQYLPSDIARLSKQNGLAVRSSSFKTDTGKLVQELKKRALRKGANAPTNTVASPRRRNWRSAATIAIALVLGLSSATAAYVHLRPTPKVSPPQLYNVSIGAFIDRQLAKDYAENANAIFQKANSRLQAVVVQAPEPMSMYWRVYVGQTLAISEAVEKVNEAKQLSYTDAYALKSN